MALDVRWSVAAKGDSIDARIVDRCWVSTERCLGSRSPSSRRAGCGGVTP